MNKFNFKITANGDTDIPVEIGKEYLFTLKGNFGGGTVTMTTRSDIEHVQFDAVIDGAWTAETEKVFAAPSKLVRLNMTGATSPNIRVVLFPKQAPSRS